LPTIEGERIQLQQVILNLILNAVEAMTSLDEGSRVLQVGTDTGAAGGVLVTVRDSGPGLDPANVDRVFEAFYTTKPEGIGMGLAICRSIITAHGGRMWTTANRPRGAIFQFTLPPKQDDTAVAEHTGQMPAR
jgi:signal transduction histidine kinase